MKKYKRLTGVEDYDRIMSEEELSGEEELNLIEETAIKKKNKNKK